ncbi:MAG TPA: hypothetical protein VJ860_07375 [Polyangia bacterium]|nr:hypothetical protein [Polyangia bacterium]
MVFAPAEKKNDDATARGGSGGGSKGPEGEGAKGEAAQVTEKKEEEVVELNGIEPSAS